MRRTWYGPSIVALVLSWSFFHASAQGQREALVHCGVAVEPEPCVVVATQPADIAGIWRQYVGRPDLAAPDGMGYQRIERDGSFVIADSIANTSAPFGAYPFGTYAFEDGAAVLSVAAEGVPPMCQTARLEFYVYRYGDQPIALVPVPIEDDCPPRLIDLRYPWVWVAPVD